jgi:hypothetical protein
MEDKKILFIEGEPNSPNGNLREGFTKLLNQKLSGKLPRIKLGGGKSTVIKQYLKNKFEAQSILLIDLDADEGRRQSDLQKYGLAEHHETVFYMIQEMESWFLSQPDILDKYYGLTINRRKVSEKLKNKKVSEIQNPKEELKDLTKSLNNGEQYHEIKHAVELLERLDASKLENDFPDFKRLIERLK